jgi:hypothetical protein
MEILQRRREAAVLAKLCGSLYASWKRAARTDPATAARKIAYSSPQTADAGLTELADGVSEMGGGGLLELLLASWVA